jgi:hypothetical protein
MYYVKMFLLLSLLSFVFLGILVLVNSVILEYFPKDYPLRVWWEKHICSSEDFEPKD